MYEQDAKAAAEFPKPELCDFGEVIKGLKAGKAYARLGWNRQGQFIFRVPGSKFTVSREPLLSQLGEGTPVNYRSHIDIKTIDGSISVWNPSQRDMEAEDWFEVVGALKGQAA
jgi:hypothetical protein